MIKKTLSLWLLSLVLASMTGLVLAQYNASALPDFTTLIKDNKAAIVNISAMQKPEIRSSRNPLPDYFRRYEGPESQPRQRSRESLGSGFLISQDGYVLTNSHVVKNAEKITVRLSNRRGYPAEIVGIDPRSDLALLKIDAVNLPRVRIGRSKHVEVGEWVLAIGSPFGFDYSVTAGIVSALHRSLPTERNENYVPFIQTDVAINPGNSGGPLFNLEGEVIGINAQIYTRTGSYIGVSFAIPIDVAMEVVEQLKTSGKVARGWLGVAIQEVDLRLAESFGLSRPQGALVSQVIANSPAENYGIQSGDIILQLNGHPVPISSELPHLVGRILPNTEVSLDIMRNKHKIRLKVKLGELPSRQENLLPPNDHEERQDDSSGVLRAKLGIRAIEVPDNLKNMLNQAGFEGGAYVEYISDGPAADADIRRGDVLVSIDNQPIRSSDDLERMLAGLTEDAIVPVHIFRRGSHLYVALRIDADADS